MNELSTHPDLPGLPLDAWNDSKVTLNLYVQIVGKIRLALHPKLNHWWHVPLYVSARGLTTRAVPAGEDIVDLEFDLLDHNLLIRSSNGRRKVVSLYDGLSVAQFYAAVVASLAQVGVQVELHAHPFDPARVGSELPFAEDNRHARYDPSYVTRFWRTLLWADRVFTEFKGRFYGKSTPVHFFWHSFDLALTRFSGRRVPEQEGVDPVTREAYSHEVISFGFWPGDTKLRTPAFYAYAAPEPAGLTATPLAPEGAFWQDSGGSAMALLNYENLRHTRDPKGALLDFLESAYLAAATKAGWDIDAFKNEHVEYSPLA